MKTNLFALIVFPLLFLSCSEKNEPLIVPTKPLRISSVKSDRSTEVFTYDNVGRITAYSQSSRTFPYQKYDDYSFKASYNYINTSRIDVNACCTGEIIKSIYTESLYLNESGHVDHTDGVWESYKDGRLDFKKIYQRFFKYDEDHQLISIKFSEWYDSEYTWEGRFGFCEESPWTWENTIEWKNGNPIKYVDYEGSLSPKHTSEYSYEEYKDIDVQRYPIQLPRLNEWYNPLQLSGYFGKHPASLPDKRVDIIHHQSSDEVTGTMYFRYVFDTDSTTPILLGFKTISNYYEQDYLNLWEFDIEWAECSDL